MTCVVSVINTKGGVGKSTIAFTIATYLADRNISVVLVDADPQGTLSKMSGYADPLLDGEGVSDFVLGGAFQLWPVLRMENIKIIRQDFELKNQDTQKTLESRKDRDRAMAVALARLAKTDSAPDIVIIDTIGTVSPFMDSAIIGSDVLLMPVFPEQSSTQETPILLSSLNERFNVSAAALYRDGDPDEEICLVPPVLVFANRYRNNSGPKAHYENLKELIKSADGQLRYTVKLSEAKLPQREYFGDANTYFTPPHRYVSDKKERDKLVATLEHLISDMASISPKFKNALSIEAAVGV